MRKAESSHKSVKILTGLEGLFGHMRLYAGFLRLLCVICGLMRAAIGPYKMECTKGLMHKVIQCSVQTRVGHMWGWTI